MFLFIVSNLYTRYWVYVHAHLFKSRSGWMLHEWNLGHQNLTIWSGCIWLCDYMSLFTQYSIQVYTDLYLKFWYCVWKPLKCLDQWITQQCESLKNTVERICLIYRIYKGGEGWFNLLLSLREIFTPTFSSLTYYITKMLVLCMCGSI